METASETPEKKTRPAPSAMRRAYRVREAQEITGLGKTWFFAALKSGALRSVKAGRTRLIPREEIDRLLAEGIRN